MFGAGFVARARAVVAQLRYADREIRDLAAADLGEVSVGIHLAGSNLLLPRAIAALKSEHPLLTVVVREATPDVLQTALLAGECDLVLGRLSTAAPAGLEQTMLYREPVRLVARTGHPVHALTRPTLAQLATYPWILPVEQTALRDELEAVFVHENVALPANRVECTSILTLRELLVSTDSLAVLPTLIATQDDRLSIVGTRLRSINRAVGVTVPADRPLSPAAKALLAALHHQAANLGLEHP